MWPFFLIQESGKRIACLPGNILKILDSWDKRTKFLPGLLLGLGIFKYWALILKRKTKNSTGFSWMGKPQWKLCSLCLCSSIPVTEKYFFWNSFKIFGMHKSKSVILYYDIKRQKHIDSTLYSELPFVFCSHENATSLFKASRELSNNNALKLHNFWLQVFLADRWAHGTGNVFLH